MVILLFAIVDFARIYTTMVSVESAAREAADFGTTLGAGRWQDGAPKDGTVAEMEERACVAASDLTGYADSDDDPSNGGCTNPTFAYCLTTTTGGSCLPFDPDAGCDDPLRATPCRVTVTLGYDFELLAPLRIEFLGVELGLPIDRAGTVEYVRDDRHRPGGAGPMRLASTLQCRGQALVEFALVAPMFFLLLLGIIEAGRFIFYYEVLHNATREGARYAIVNGANVDPSAVRPDPRARTPCHATRPGPMSSTASATRPSACSPGSTKLVKRRATWTTGQRSRRRPSRSRPPTSTAAWSRSCQSRPSP